MITTEIEDCITRAEILSLNGDFLSQKEAIISELTRVRQRFLNRLNEYKILLQMSLMFFQNYQKVSSSLIIDCR